LESNQQLQEPAAGALSRDEIADAALALVDREGVDALSMRRLAKELGVGTMTLYGYFRGKAELLDHAIDRAARGYDLSPGEGPWRDQLRDLVRTMWQSLAEHPGAVQVRAGRPILTPGALRAGEAGMAILTGAGFKPSDAAAAWRLLFTYVFGYAAFSSNEPTDEQKEEWRRQFKALPPGDYPHLSATADEVVEWMAGRKAFEQGLELILDGLEARFAA
jgi:AcrR family transcriptional regulator